MAVARHEQLLLWLNQSLATYLSANVSVCVRQRESGWEREQTCALRERKMTCTVWYETFFLSIYMQSHKSTLVLDRITIYPFKYIWMLAYIQTVGWFTLEKSIHTPSYKVTHSWILPVWLCSKMQIIAQFNHKLPHVMSSFPLAALTLLSQGQAEISTTHHRRTLCKVKQITPLTHLKGSTLYTLTKIYARDNRKRTVGSSELKCWLCFSRHWWFCDPSCLQGRGVTGLLL